LDPIKYWVGFNLVKGIGAVRFKQILDFFDSAEIAWDAPVSGLLSAGLPQRVVENFLNVRNQVDLDRVMDRINQTGIRVMTWNDTDYPRRLKEIDQSPPVLFIKGALNVEDDWAVAVVGTRRVTPYGRQVASEIATFLAQNGVTVISGLARGVDAIAHQTALEQGGRTFAVLGSGVDVIYPPEHRTLAESIVAHGALISDYPPGTQPDGVNFPPRNRIISGLSRGTVVIEAGEKSGALITAKFSIDQGREVFAAPGSVLSPMSRGTNNLLAAGAVPLTSPTVILKNLNITQTRPSAEPVKPTLDADEARILRALGQDTLHIDDLCGKLGTSVEKLTAELTMMELKGLVVRAKGMEYAASQTWKLD